MTPEEANKKDEKGRSWLLQSLLLGNKVPPELWCAESAGDLDQIGWSPISTMVFQHRTHEIPDLGKALIAEDASGQNPLHWCAIWGYLQELRYFLEKGANPNAKDKENKTPLDLVDPLANPTETEEIIAALKKASLARQKRLLRGNEDLCI